jgi:hypothetical protein
MQILCKSQNRLIASAGRAVEATDCWSRAYPTCMARAQDRNQIACGFAFDKGVEKCSGQQFSDNYKGALPGSSASDQSFVRPASYHAQQ